MQSKFHQHFRLQIESGLLKTLVVAIAVAIGLSVSHAENRVTGHWEGQIEIPGQPITVKIDITINDGDWRGTIDIPTQGANDLPLSDIHVVEEDGSVSVKFSILNIPGNPTFDGKLQDGAIEWHLQSRGCHIRIPTLTRDRVVKGSCKTARTETALPL